MNVYAILFHILTVLCVVVICSPGLDAFSIYLVKDEIPKIDKRMSSTSGKVYPVPESPALEETKDPSPLSDVLSSYMAHLQSNYDNQLYNWRSPAGSIMLENQNLACTKFDCTSKPCCNGICAYVFGSNLCLTYGKR